MSTKQKILRTPSDKSYTVLKTAVLLLFLTLGNFVHGQPEPCITDEMTSTCMDACVVCDIDGFTGTNNLTIQGQTFPGFCTTIYHNMSYIAFIAGTENLTINVSVTNCTINEGVEIGIFESGDCETFTAVTECNTDVAPNSTATFSNLVPLVVGQHYYLILDGSKGDICDWTFQVTEGSTAVGELSTSGIIEGLSEICSNVINTYSIDPPVGATIFDWTIDGILQNSNLPFIDVEFPSEGTYELCVTASNVCDKAPPSCKEITIKNPEPTFLIETVCYGDCIDVAGENICETGEYEYHVIKEDGCDSVIYLDLIVLDDLHTSIEISLCEGETFYIDDMEFSTTGVFVETILSNDFCDSLVTLDLTMIDCEIQGTINSQSPTCHNDTDAMLIFFLENGIPPYNYEWKNILDTTISGSGTAMSTTDITIGNIPAGIYEIYIYDNFGNDLVFIQEITNPSALSILLESSDNNGYGVSCYDGNDGMIFSSPKGGIPEYNLMWNNNETEEDLMNLAAGLYTVSLTDNNGCIITESIELTAPDPIELLVEYIDPGCDGLASGVIQLLNISGGVSPYLNTLDESPFIASTSFQNLPVGEYTFTTMDNNGCIADTTAILYEVDIPIIYLDTDLEVELGKSILISASTNDSEIINIEWVDVENSLDCQDCLETNATPYNDTDYILMVTSVDGCVTSATIRVTVDKNRQVYSPNIFTPNNDFVNDVFFIGTNQTVLRINTMKIYNRWGELVYENTDFLPNEPNQGWDGTFKGIEINNGIYVWMAEIEYLDGVIEVLSGDITLSK